MKGYVLHITMKSGNHFSAYSGIENLDGLMDAIRDRKGGISIMVPFNKPRSRVIINIGEIESIETTENPVTDLPD